MLIPLARWPRSSATGIRVPVITASPPRIPGSEVMPGKISDEAIVALSVDLMSFNDQMMHGLTVGTRGREEQVRGPCACPRCNAIRSLSFKSTALICTRDKHKAPTHPHHPPLVPTDGSKTSASVLIVKIHQVTTSLLKFRFQRFSNLLRDTLHNPFGIGRSQIQ